MVKGGVFVLLAIIAQAYGFIEVYLPKTPIVVLKELKKSTVTLSEVKLYTRRNVDDSWKEMKGIDNRIESDMHMYSSDEDGMKVEMSVYEAPDDSWISLTSVGVSQYVSKMSHFGSKVNFLWTSGKAGHYMFLFRIVHDKHHNTGAMEVGMNVVTYEGRPEDPSIYSHTDSQIRNKEKRIAECINISKEILELQDIDRMDENKYTQVTNGIFRAIIWTVFLKIVVFIGSFLFINRKIQQFYVEKKIVIKR
ncbi:hypothetical protein NEFER01_0708 [Nematocida sp. LUAm1]|nr:hypothetical protein NEFER02_1043 [Nematocida sp. LUAm2]KAI5177458.1 hypothetical protein NEFER01_0708 [Nematocida sp. LUAm1]